MYQCPEPVRATLRHAATGEEQKLERCQGPGCPLCAQGYTEFFMLIGTRHLELWARAGDLQRWHVLPPGEDLT